MRRCGGFTVLEILVAMVLSAMLMTAVYRLLLGGAHLFQRVQMRSELQDQGLMSLSRLAADLRASSWGSVTIHGGAIAMAAPGAAASTVYYFDTVQHCLVRGLATCPNGLRFDAPQLLAATTAGVTEPVVLARHVTAFTLTPGSFPGNTPQIEAVHASLWLAPDTKTEPEFVTVSAVPRN